MAMALAPWTRSVLRACLRMTVSQSGDSPQAPWALPPMLLQGLALVTAGPEPEELALAQALSQALVSSSG